MNKQAGKRLRRALRIAKQAKKLYLAGMPTKVIAEELNRSKITINRYFILMGGVNLDERRRHLKNKRAGRGVK